LLPFTVPAGGTLTGINLCDWSGPGGIPTPPAGLAPAQPTPALPPDGVSLNCDGTYQRLRIDDSGSSGKTISVDYWNGSGWDNAWNLAAGDPMVRQLTDQSGWIAFGGCQKLVAASMLSTGPQLWLDLTIYVWDGSGLTQVYSNSGYYGSWIKSGDTIQSKDASKLGTVNNGPLSPCQYVTLEHTWNGSAFQQTGSHIQTDPGCTVTVQ
jgi:hypothetical protein